jgi:hypothetical protein
MRLIGFIFHMLIYLRETDRIPTAIGTLRKQTIASRMGESSEWRALSVDGGPPVLCWRASLTVQG